MMRNFKLCLGVLAVLFAAGCGNQSLDPADEVLGLLSQADKSDISPSSVTGTEAVVPVFAITNFDINTVDFMNTRGRVLASRAIGGDGAHGIAFGEGKYVVASTGGAFGGGPPAGRIVSFLNRDATIARPALADGVVTENVFFGDGVFLITKWNQTVMIIDKNGRVICPGIRLGPSPIGAAFGDGVFVVADFAGTVAIIDSNGVILKRDIWVGSGLRNVAFGDGVFAVTASGDDAVTILDKTGRILVPHAPVGRSPRGIAFGEGVFMVSNALGNSVSIIDKTGRRVAADVPIGRVPKDMAFGNGIFVIANFEDNTVSFVTKRGVRLGNFPVRNVGGRAAPVGVTFGELLR